MGIRGATTAGPTGATGRAGPAGAQGPRGFSGAAGSAEMVGMQGRAGPSGVAGSRGSVGPTGAQGPMAVKGTWTSYWEYTFNGDSNEIFYSERGNAGEIARYLNQNQSYRIGLDGADTTRVGIIRDALIRAGVPSDKIQTGALGDPQLRTYGRVEVLVRN